MGPRFCIATRGHAEKGFSTTRWRAAAAKKWNRDEGAVGKAKRDMAAAVEG
jgi:hypothetical protein